MRASEERYRELFQDSQDTIFISTPEGRIIDINPAGLELLGFDRKEDLLQVNIAEELYQDPEDRQRMLELMAKQGFCRDYELRLKRRDGTPLRVLETTTAVKDSSGSRHRSARGTARRDARAPAGATAPACAEDGGGRSPGRWRGARLQQSADGDQRPQRSASHPTRARQPAGA